ncbi:MAG: hypothetical protein DI554_07095 [Sphingobium sp.]|nr:MAG: hypothetical protein DI554_07095 [Sphingobium sp.]
MCPYGLRGVGGQDKRLHNDVITRGTDMASDGNIQSATQTYEGFVGFVKWGTIACLTPAEPCRRYRRGMLI